MLTVLIHSLGDVTVFRCTGRITSDTTECLRKAVVDQPHMRTAVLDLEQIGAIDAAGLGTLLSLRSWAQNNGRKFKLMNLLPRVRRILDLTHLEPAFDVCTAQEMLDLLCRASAQSNFQVPAEVVELSARSAGHNAARSC